jgi:hypothetical protein
MNDAIIKELGALLQAADWATVATTVSTVILAILTAIYVNLTRKILQAQADPCVIVSVVNDKVRPTLLMLVIRNVGAGLAKDIFFELSRDIPQQAYGLEPKT